MQVFYSPDISKNIYTLDENESKHIIRVLRMKKGSSVKLIDGRGNLYEGIIDDPNPKSCSILINKKTENYEKRNYKLHIAISPLKNQDRFEWFVEKSVEIGVDEITPLICKNTEKQSVKPERLEKIIVSAMKQSLKAYRTVLNDPTEFNEFILRRHVENPMIAHCNNDFEKHNLQNVCKKGDNTLILIGPEGDFNTEEIESATAQGFHSVHLGTSRLRTETAGVAACHSIYFINQ